ncbi:MAG: ATP-dependent RNA helicase HrpA [Betaproteobacteria bacterium]|nr:ATP-dependent RNA helicase HrpA [Betaproteobacteria bacterium]
MEASRQARFVSLSSIEFPEVLPVSQRIKEIHEAILKHQVVILCGETGSGKTTQLPKICLKLGRGIKGLIGHTQPRRIAARSVASRIASELKVPLGDVVGFKIRFADKVSPQTLIKVMTDGVLLAETQTDPDLKQYDTIIIDEAHERSLNIDFLLGYLKQLTLRRSDLKIIITSATIDVESFSKHFNDAPIIEVSGRTYPVEIRYRPLEVKDEDDQEEKIEEAILDVVKDFSKVGGDTLIFLPGEREIRDVADFLKAKLPPHYEVLPLFARLSYDEQQKIFRGSNGRRIILSTNVAETSLTVPGIKYVIDPGIARVNRYSTRNKVEQLQIEKISQASAKQRSGRCGRVSDGICVRLYSEEDFNARPLFLDPEIYRSSLASVILKMASLHLGDVSQFPFIQPPSRRFIQDGYLLLQELGAVNDHYELTPIGRDLAKLPMDPRLGRMLLLAKKENALSELLIIVSALSIQDPRERPLDKKAESEAAQVRFFDEKSDFVSYLKLWTFFDEAIQKRTSQNQLRKLCHAHFLSYLRMREWRDLYEQIRELLLEMHFKMNEIPANYMQIHRSILSGLLGNIGTKALEDDSYVGARNIHFHLSPGSNIKRRKSKWVMAAELVDTTKLYARTAAEIDVTWIESLSHHLVEHHHTDPYWDTKLARVNAHERISLYGLTIVPKRNVHFGPINPEIAREIFIRQGLVQGGYVSKGIFWKHNQDLISEVELLEHKARRLDVLVNEEDLFQFYDTKIPPGIINGDGFEDWRREIEVKEPKALFLTKALLMKRDANEITEVQYPETLDIDGVMIPLKYRFEPGHMDDGVTAMISEIDFHQLDLNRLQWLVPGMIREKLNCIFKSLPKHIRIQLLPLADSVTEFLTQYKTYHHLFQSISDFILKKTKEPYMIDQDEIESLPRHCFMNIEVINQKNEIVIQGRDLNLLKNSVKPQVHVKRNEKTNGIERFNLKRWDFDALPNTLDLNAHQKDYKGFVGLSDEDESVSIRVFVSEEEMKQSHRQGVLRLLSFELKPQLKQLEKELNQLKEAQIYLRDMIEPDELRSDVIEMVLDSALSHEEVMPRNASDFLSLVKNMKHVLPQTMKAMLDTIHLSATYYHQLKELLNKLTPIQKRSESIFINRMHFLIHNEFILTTPSHVFSHLPRYLKALKIRIEKYASRVDKDALLQKDIDRIHQLLDARLKPYTSKKMTPPKALKDFQWQIEELHVSLFAQDLKTAYPVSLKRLEKALDDIPYYV